MKERGIIFSGPMVRAILAGDKTQTRRLAWRRCKVCGGKLGMCKGPHRPSNWQTVTGGMILWVRERARGQGWDPAGDYETFAVEYDADGATIITRVQHTGNSKPYQYPKWSSPIHMPRWASRITLEVTRVRVQPVCEISEDDARAEGVRPEFEMDLASFALGKKLPPSTYFLGFKHRWRELHGAESWKANPDVVAITFRRVKP